MIKTFVSSLSPSQAVDCIREIGDLQEVDPESRSFYRGNKPILWSLRDERFRLLRRPQMSWVWWLLTPGSWFQPHISGRVLPREKGSELELEGGANLAVKIGWVLAFGILTGLIAVITLFHYPVDINFAAQRAGDHIRAAVILLNVLGGIMVLLPLVGWLMTRNDLDFLVKELQKRLDLQEVPLR
jgi:hypothetical protein